MEGKTEFSQNFSENAPKTGGFTLLIAVLGLVIAFSLFPLLINTIVRKITSSFMAENEEEKQLKKETSEQKQKLKLIHMVDEFAKYAKVERQIIKLTEKKKQFDNKRSGFAQKVKIGVIAGFHISKVLCTIILLWFYRNTPIILLPESWTSPFGYFVSFPSGVPGGIGVVFWMLICNTAVNRLMKAWAVK